MRLADSCKLCWRSSSGCGESRAWTKRVSKLGPTSAPPDDGDAGSVMVQLVGDAQMRGIGSGGIFCYFISR
jgi:hypothetical protein